MSQILVTGEAKIRDIQGPVVSNSGVITALDGDASQYVRGDGTLADFPTSTGGGSSVSYYLNSSVSQGTIGGVAYRQLSKTPISGAGTDITASTNGYIASYITDANDPALLEVPAGNFNCEFYFSVNSNAHNPYVYAELYKYDGTTFTLLGSNVAIPEYLTNGTTLSAYYFAIPVAVAALTITDRLAIRIYVNVDGRVVTLHTENNHLCQVVTTFSKGLISLNNLTRQNQFFGTGTDGTDFNISSATATHTFNIPSASATNRGLITTGSQTIAGSKTFSNNVNLNSQLFINGGTGYGGGVSYRQGGILSFNDGGTTTEFPDANSIKYYVGQGSNNYKNFVFDVVNITLNATRTFNLPDLSGTLALLEGTQTFSGAKTFSAATKQDAGILLKNGFTTYSNSYTSLAGNIGNLIISGSISGTPFDNELAFTPSTSNTFTFPDASGTIALTSNLSAYVPYTGATADVDLGASDLSGYYINGKQLTAKKNGTTGGALFIETGTGYSFGGVSGVAIASGTPNNLIFNFVDATATNTKSVIFSFGSITNNVNRTYTLPDASGTIALLSGTQTFTGATTFSSDLLVSGLTIGRGSSAVVGNTAIGLNSLFTNTTGLNNSALGYNSLRLNTTGGNNTAIGVNALQNNTTTSSNTAIGYNSLNANTTGASNTAIGSESLISNTTGSNNIALGNTSGNAITTGSNNTIIGNYAGTTTLANNIVLADGAGTIRYQWNGTNNVFGNPITGTSATFSSSVTANGITNGDGTADTRIVTRPNNAFALGVQNSTTSNIYYLGVASSAATANFQIYNTFTAASIFSMTYQGAATFSSSVTAASGLYNGYTSGLPPTSGSATRGGLRLNNASNIALDFGTVAAGQAWLQVSDANNYASNFALLLNPNGGNVGIGTTDPSAKLDINGFGGTLAGTAAIVLRDFNSGGSRRWSISNGAGGNAVDQIGKLIIGVGTSVSGDPLAGTNVMTMTSVGDVLVNSSTTSSGAKFNVFFSDNTNNGQVLRETTGNASVGYLLFNSNGTQTGSVTRAGATNAVLYNTTSDYRLKEDLKEIKGLEKISSIKVYDFKWKGTDSRMDGVIAHELAEVLPYAVNGEKDGLDKDGKEFYQGVDYSKLVPILVKAVQELNERIKQLENK